DRRKRAIELGNPRRARELVLLHARNGARVDELALEQRLPMLGDMPAQAGDEENGMRAHGSEVRFRQLERGVRAADSCVAQARRLREEVIGEMARSDDLGAQEGAITATFRDRARRDERRTRELRTAEGDAGELEEWHGTGEYRACVASLRLRYETARSCE